jgi:ABC-type branched-subunit amino acid transport system permease subunit
MLLLLAVLGLVILLMVLLFGSAFVMSSRASRDEEARLESWGIDPYA